MTAEERVIDARERKDVFWRDPDHFAVHRLSSAEEAQALVDNAESAAAAAEAALDDAKTAVRRSSTYVRWPKPVRKLEARSDLVQKEACGEFRRLVREVFREEARAGFYHRPSSSGARTKTTLRRGGGDDPDSAEGQPGKFLPEWLKESQGKDKEMYSFDKTVDCEKVFSEPREPWGDSWRPWVADRRGARVVDEPL